MFTLFVDPETAALATPVELPLDIERHIRSLGDESGSSRVVVEETITQKAGDIVAATQTNVYVMDRRTLQNVADDRAYAFRCTMTEGKHMKALLERSTTEHETIDAKDTAGPANPKTTDDCDLRDLARRCGELLAQRTTAECPPGHWLG